VAARWLLLQGGDVAVAAVPVEVLVGLLQEWLEAGEAVWEGTVRVPSGSDALSAAHDQVVTWATSHWDAMTYDQAVAVYDLLCSRSAQEVPIWVERSFMKGLVSKTLTKAAAGAAAAGVAGRGDGGGSDAAACAGAAAAGGGGGEVVSGRAFHDELQHQVEERQLAAVLELCEMLGPKADWIR
jgi:hypothetical protein